ncbi:MAG: molybdopterin cofactor-binding domain-containing protein [Caulobacteraceae bacterium]
MIPPSLANNPVIDRWVGFEAAGRVRVAFGKVEYGQGAATALAQIAAEELDVSMSRLNVVNAATDEVPDEGLTVGSMSVEMSGAALRYACAQARELMLAEAARRAGCASSDLDVEDGVILKDGEPTGEDYWTLAPSVDLKIAPAEGVRWKTPDQHRLLGQSTPRLDLPPKVFGAAFIQDITLPGMIHARVLRQPGPKATLVSLDEVSVQRAAPGVDILIEGSFIAFLSGDETTAKRAVEAAEQIVVWNGARDFDPKLSEAVSLKELPSSEFASAEPPETPSNRRRVKASYSKPYLAHGSMGPACGVAVFEDGRLEAYTHAQGVYPMRQMLARACALDIAKITVRHAQGAGNYGHNGSDDACVDAAVIAMRRPGVPIRVQWRREDEMGFSPVGTAMHMELTGELDAAGRLVHFESEIWSGQHVSRGRALAETALPRNDPPPTQPAFNAVASEAAASAPAGAPAAPVMRFSGGRINAVPSYDIESNRLVEHTITATPVRTSSLRGLGGPPNIYAAECFIDECAEAAGADPLAYRISMLSDPRAIAVLRKAGEMSNWAARGPAGTGKGLGIGYARHRDRGGMVAVVVAVEVDDEVRLKHIWCAADCGLIINPDGAINQLEGGIIQAASWTLKEQVKLDRGGVTSVTWADYPILRMNEIPPVDTVILEAKHIAPQGIGEVSSGPAMGAIGNAVAHALGARVRHMPFTRERIARALNA